MPRQPLTLSVEHVVESGECHRVAYLGSPDHPLAVRLAALNCGVAERHPELLKEWAALVGLFHEAVAASVAASIAADDARRQARRSAAPNN